MKKNNKLFLTIGCVAAVVIIGLSVWNLNSNGSIFDFIRKEEQESQSKKEGNSESAPVSADELKDKEESDNKSEAEENDQSDSGIEPVSDGTAWEERWLAYKNMENSSQVSAESEKKEKIQFPYSIPNSNLIIRAVDSYDGIYLEDGSDSDISGVAAILVENTGNENIEYTSIRLSGDNGTLTFTGTGLPANSKSVILADDRAGYPGNSFNSASATVSDPSDFSMPDGKVQIVSDDDNKLAVKNVSNSDIPEIRIFYKFYLPEQQSFVGGVTYTSVIKDLPAGETTEIEPSHYETGSSKVIMIRTYE